MTPSSEERLKILQMLEDGKITPEDASRLLQALSKKEQAGPVTAAAPGDAHRFIRVHVTDLISGKDKVNVTAPLSLVKFGLRIAEKYALEETELDVEELEAAIVDGAEGMLVEVTDSKDNERIEVYVE